MQNIFTIEPNNKIKYWSRGTIHQEFVYLVWSSNDLHIGEKIYLQSSINVFFYKEIQLLLIEISLQQGNSNFYYFSRSFLYPRDLMISLLKMFTNCFSTIESLPKKYQLLIFDFLRISYVDLLICTQVAHNPINLSCVKTVILTP